MGNYISIIPEDFAENFLLPQNLSC